MSLSGEEFAAELNYINRVLHEFSKEDDRAAAVLVAAELDRLILLILSKHLLKSEHSSSPLLERGGPLESFAARIELAYRLGLLPPAMHHDLQILRKIRNLFAHGSVGMTFDQPKLAELAHKLAIGNHEIRSMFRPEVPEEQRQKMMNPRNLFRITASIIMGHLGILPFQIAQLDPKWPAFFHEPPERGTTKREQNPK